MHGRRLLGLTERHPDHQVFIDAIDSATLVVVEFFSKADGRMLVRACAPMDYAPPSRGRDRSHRYHFWDYESGGLLPPHPLSMLADQIRRMSPTSDRFDPGDFVTWPPRWSYPREWGRFS